MHVYIIKVVIECIYVRVTEYMEKYVRVMEYMDIYV